MLDAARGALSQADYIHNRKAQQVIQRWTPQEALFHRRITSTTGKLSKLAQCWTPQEAFFHRRITSTTGKLSKLVQRWTPQEAFFHRRITSTTGKRSVGSISEAGQRQQTPQKYADPLRETLHVHHWENCRSTQGNSAVQGTSADPFRKTLQIHSMGRVGGRNLDIQVRGDCAVT